MITVSSFRVDFSEFGSVADYPSSGIQYYIALGGLLLNKRRFGPPSPTVKNPPDNMYDMALELFVAHHVSLEATAQRAAAAGGVPGVATGPVSGKSVGPVSISYDPGDTIDSNAGHWNTTMYGQRLWRLIMMFGAGGIQVNVGAMPCGEFFNNVPLNGPAWPGPVFIQVGSVN